MSTHVSEHDAVHTLYSEEDKARLTYLHFFNAAYGCELNLDDFEEILVKAYHGTPLEVKALLPAPIVFVPTEFARKTRRLVEFYRKPPDRAPLSERRITARILFELDESKSGKVDVVNLHYSDDLAVFDTKH